jgi:hypothetical protein
MGNIAIKTLQGCGPISLTEPTSKTFALADKNAPTAIQTGMDDGQLLALWADMDVLPILMFCRSI